MPHSISLSEKQRILAWDLPTLKKILCISEIQIWASCVFFFCFLSLSLSFLNLVTLLYKLEKEVEGKCHKVGSKGKWHQ
jgi:hypothetical protein